ncbi:hypothetical protein [Streptomyces sp. NRRL S-350]|uniref:hypothetical protein n=1 Tax=Streptomyces sp. NRRL S-350 TaxID=1463902 RepID=UPI0004BF452A|nr:hypothetical protein [Streptomyces sp. NRRL S-350]
MPQTTTDTAAFVQALGTAQYLTNKILAGLGVNMWVGVAYAASPDYPMEAISLDLWNTTQHAFMALERQLDGEDYVRIAKAHEPLQAAATRLALVHHYAIEGAARPGALAVIQGVLDHLADVIGHLYMS